MSQINTLSICKDTNINPHKKCADFIKSFLANEYLVLIALFLFCLLFHFVCGNFIKKLTTYSDEIKYYDIAYCIWHGLPFSVNNVPTNYQKIGYSILLAPFFAISDGLLRVKCITLFNSLLISLSLIPTFLICKHFKINKPYLYLPLLFLSIFPETMISGTFMSESLYWPLFLFTFYIWIKNEEKLDVFHPILLAILCYATYLCKEIFISFPVCFCIYKMWIYTYKSLFLYQKDKRQIKNLMWFMGAFIFLYVTIQWSLFHTLTIGESYNQQGLYVLSKAYNIFYILYAMIFYFVCIGIVSFLFPIIIPATNFNDLEKSEKCLFLFTLLVMLCMIFVIAYTISVREDLGREGPRVHLRYLSPLIILLFTVFFSLLSHTKKIVLKFKHILFFVLSILFFFKQYAIGSAVDEYSLKIIYRILIEIGSLAPINGKGSLIIYPNIIILSFMMLFLFGFLYCMYRNSKKLFEYSLSIIMALCLITAASYGGKKIFQAYRIDSNYISDITQIKSYLSDKKFAHILIPVISIHDTYKKVIDTYLDQKELLLCVNTDTFKNFSAAHNKIANLQLRDIRFHKKYKGINTIDYILLPKNANPFPLKLVNVEKIDLGGHGYFTLYKNIDKKLLCLALEKRLFFNFTSSGYNAGLIAKSGTSLPEENFTWLDGKLAHFSIPIGKNTGIKGAKIKFDIYDTFDGSQRYIVYQKKGRVLAEGKGNNNFSISFNALAQNGNIEFFIETPDAHTPLSKNYSGDGRILSFAIKSMDIEFK